MKSRVESGWETLATTYMAPSSVTAMATLSPTQGASTCRGWRFQRDRARLVSAMPWTSTRSLTLTGTASADPAPRLSLGRSHRGQLELVALVGELPASPTRPLVLPDQLEAELPVEVGRCLELAERLERDSPIAGLPSLGHQLSQQAPAQALAAQACVEHEPPQPRLAFPFVRQAEAAHELAVPLDDPDALAWPGEASLSGARQSGSYRRLEGRVDPVFAGVGAAVEGGYRGEVDELRGLVRGRVSIGALLPAGPIDVPQLLVHFAEEFPGIDVRLREGTAGDMLRYLAVDEVDAAFTLQAELPDDLEAEHLGEDELLAAFPPGKGPDHKFVGPAQFVGGPLVTPRSDSAIAQALREFFADAGEPLHVSLESGDPFLLRCLVSTGFGASVLPSSLLSREGPPVDVRPLRPAVRLPVTLVWRR